MTSSLAADTRLGWLVDVLAAEGSVSIARAAEALGVSEMTIRRDLAELEEQGTARRFRGGAKAVGPQPFATRHHRAGRAKSCIASKLALLLPKTGAVALDASSTVMRVISHFADARDLTVLTNGPDCFSALQGLSGVAALLTGGCLEPRTGSLVGPFACRAATQLEYGLFLASAAAVDRISGALETSIDEAEVKRTIAARAQRTVLAADRSKLGLKAPAVGLEWPDIDILVTDLDAKDRRLDPYRDRVEIL